MRGHREKKKAEKSVGLSPALTAFAFPSSFPLFSAFLCALSFSFSVPSVLTQFIF